MRFILFLVWQREESHETAEFFSLNLGRNAQTAAAKNLRKLIAVNVAVTVLVHLLENLTRHLDSKAVGQLVGQLVQLLLGKLLGLRKEKFERASKRTGNLDQTTIIVPLKEERRD